MSSPHPQSRIDELTVQNRNLSHTIQRLKNELSNEEGRRNTIVEELRAQWQSEKNSWTEMQHCYKIHQLRLVSLMEGLRTMVEKEKEARRIKCVEKGGKEVDLLFAARREIRLKWTVSELSQELESLKVHMEEEREEIIAQYQEAIEKLKAKCKEFANETIEKINQLAEVQEERDKLESELATLKSKHDALDVNSATASNKLERVTLQLDGAQTTIADLKRQTGDLERANASLKRQLEKWQNLDSKGEAQANGERKRRMELEVQVKELEERLKQNQELEKTLEKEKRKSEKLKALVVEWQAEVEQGQKDVEQAEADLKEAKAQQAKLQKKIDKLTAQLAEGHGKAHAPSNKKSPKEADSESEDHESSRAASPAAEEPIKQVKAKSKPAPKGKSNQVNLAEDSDAELVEGPSAKMQGKRKAVEKDRPRKNVEDSDVETIEKSKRKPEKEKSSGKGKSRSAQGDDQDDEERSQGGKDTSRAGTRAVDESKGKRSRAPSRAEAQDENKGKEEDGEIEAKKKKRKMNPFPTAQAAPIDWGQLALGDGGMNIPTMLSPVKESSIVQDNSTGSTSLLSRVGSLLGGTGRK